MGICCMAQETQTGAVSVSRGGMGQEMGGRFKREWIYIYLWLIHVEVWQKTKFCKANTLQYKNFFKMALKKIPAIGMRLPDVLKVLYFVGSVISHALLLNLVSRSQFSSLEKEFLWLKDFFVPLSSLKSCALWGPICPLHLKHCFHFSD